MNDILGGRPVWLRVCGRVVQPLPADCHHVGHLSLAAGARGLGDVVTMIVAAVAAVLVVGVAVVGTWSWRRNVRPVTAAERHTVDRPSDLDTVHVQLRREFASVVGIAASLPASVTAHIPLLDDRIGIAAHSTYRLLETVRRAPTDARFVEACVRQAQRVGSAVIGLHRALVAAKLEAASGVSVNAVAQAIVAVDQAVDGLYVEVTMAVPPFPPGQSEHTGSS